MRVLRVGEAGAERLAVLDGAGGLLDASGVADDIDHRSLPGRGGVRVARGPAGGGRAALDRPGHPGTRG
ncbi:2-hydroxyhepta-2,4-diene-1,7-dioate isomerase, partial [Streptomyces sp. NPDC059556]